jgi:hypothetical protein
MSAMADKLNRLICPAVFMKVFRVRKQQQHSATRIKAQPQGTALSGTQMFLDASADIL